MVDPKEKEEFIKSYIDIIKPMTSEERGALMQDLIKVSLNLSIEESLSPEGAKAFYGSKKDVS